MKLQILSLNVEDLNKGVAADVLQAYIQACSPAIDIILLQEHKLRGQLFHQVEQRLWRGSIGLI